MLVLRFAIDVVAGFCCKTRIGRRSDAHCVCYLESMDLGARHGVVVAIYVVLSPVRVGTRLNHKTDRRGSRVAELVLLIPKRDIPIA